ncbi:sigma-70 family RNA polymerase sigma factor [bacterium]|nr:sigma-70 family RNA polymerase sigma factor [bacterium]
MHSPGDRESTRRVNPERWVDEHGDVLYRYALARVRDSVIAEDLVQETFLSALKGADRFAGQSAERSWLVGILKHKIADHFRRQQREEPAADADAATETAELFAPNGHWRTGAGLAPANWGRDAWPRLDRQEFWAVLDRCLAGLTPRLRRAFLLRELEELDSDAICKVLEVTPTNLWVLLHRARRQLRRCLEVNWFQR